MRHTLGLLATFAFCMIMLRGPHLKDNLAAILLSIPISIIGYCLLLQLYWWLKPASYFDR
jgi:hypothetical protein